MGSSIFYWLLPRPTSRKSNSRKPLDPAASWRWIPALRIAISSVVLALAACEQAENQSATPEPSTSPPAAVSAVGHPNFMSPHASPIIVAGDEVFVVNTPADTVDVIGVASRTVKARIGVGIDPVSLAVRPDGLEVWASNHVSDSVSVIDNDPDSPTYRQVVATIQDLDPITKSTRFDEPMGIAFASDEKAYIALSSENQIAVVDTATRQVTDNLDIPAQDPRAIKVRDGRLYVIPFESNNQTQLSGCCMDASDPTCVDASLAGEIGDGLCTFDANEHSIINNNVLSTNAVVDIIKHPQVPDRDLFVFDTATDTLLDVVDTAGTLLYGLAVDSTGQVYITQTDARNDANGLAGSDADGLAEMDNRAFLNGITQVDCGAACGLPEIIDLEPLPPVDPEPEMALATPFAIQVSGDDSLLLVSAAGSNSVFTLGAESGQVLGRAQVGPVPRGIALESDPEGRATRAWVLSIGDNSVALVDLSDPLLPQVLETIALEDPTHPLVKTGRIAFNDARASTTGTFSCESCHPDGGTDQLLWVLDTPICNLQGCNQIPPRVTMPIRGLRDTTPYHWDGIPGDPYGGKNTANIFPGDEAPNCQVDDPESCTRFLVDGALASTMCMVGNCPGNEEGKAGALTASERDAMATFLLSVPYPPSQRRSYDNVLSGVARDGFRLFHIDGDLQGNPQPNVCGDCHRMPFLVSTNTFFTGMDAPTWRGAYDRWLILPQGRLNIIDFSFYRAFSAVGTPEQAVWRLSWAFRPRFDPVWNMVTEGSTGFSGSFARSVSLNPQSISLAQTSDLLDALELSASEEAIVLQGTGVFIDSAGSRHVALEFDPAVGAGAYIEGGENPQSHTRAELLSLAESGGFVGTLTGRLGVNADVDHPQPALWTRSSIQSQSGRQQFPRLSSGDSAMIISGRHIEPGAHVIVNGRRVAGNVNCVRGELPTCGDERIRVELDTPPETPGVHFLQLQNPDGLFSNDFIFHRS
jgi:YVTN family beta-propeller protein